MDSPNRKRSCLWCGVLMCLAVNLWLMQRLDEHHPVAPQFHLEEVTTKTVSPLVELVRQVQQQQLAATTNTTTSDSVDEESLPRWKDVVDRFGSQPVILGLEQCSKFQATIDPAEAFVAPAGIFNSGTNLLAELLIQNCQLTKRQQKHGARQTGVRWQVNWGKHSPARFRFNNSIEPQLNNTFFLPIVTIRHPYSWLQSMCRRRYSTHWFHHAELHCPNFIPNHVELEWYTNTKQQIYKVWSDPWLRDNLLDKANYTPFESQVVPVRVRYKVATLYHTSLLHMWNEWYRDYYQYHDLPRILVRLEDLVYHAQEVTTQVCACAGGSLKGPFQHVLESAKKGGDNIHGSERTNFMDAIRKHVQDNWTAGMTLEDVEYAKDHVDMELVQTFRYAMP